MSAGPLIVVVGSLNADLVVRVRRFPRAGETIDGEGFARYPGGKGANQAYAAARLGGRAAMVGLVGNDEPGSWLVECLRAGGVDTAAVGHAPGEPTGVALITIDGEGQNHIVVVPGANASMTASLLARAAGPIGDAAVVMLQLEIPVETVVAAARAARAAGAIVIVDPAPARPVPDELLQLADYVTPNETELAVLTGGGTAGSIDDIRRRAGQLHARGCRRVVVKCGGAGAYLFVEGRAALHWPPHAVDAVDTTAAGDAFNAAFAVALAEGEDAAAAGRFAAAAAAVSVTRAGAQPGMPDRREVDELLAGPRP
jgi:ribokinase